MKQWSESARRLPAQQETNETNQVRQCPPVSWCPAIQRRSSDRVDLAGEGTEAHRVNVWPGMLQMGGTETGLRV